MLIKEIMDTDVVECTEDAPLAEVYDLIQQCQKGYVVVLDSSQHRVPLGVVNEHTICENLVKRSRNTKDLSAVSVMSAKIRRVCENENIENCRDLIVSDADAIIVVNESRKFQGVVQLAEIQRSILQPAAAAHRASIFSSMLGQSIPAAVEIPAFGWLK
jgi:predicted transcriptional regulator